MTVLAIILSCLGLICLGMIIGYLIFSRYYVDVYMMGFQDSKLTYEKILFEAVKYTSVTEDQLKSVFEEAKRYVRRVQVENEYRKNNEQ